MLGILSFIGVIRLYFQNDIIGILINFVAAYPFLGIAYSRVKAGFLRLLMKSVVFLSTLKIYFA